MNASAAAGHDAVDVGEEGLPSDPPGTGPDEIVDTRLADFAAEAAAAGLTVRLADGSERAIPLSATPLIVDDTELAERSDTARLLVAATARAARWRLRGPQRDSLLAAMGQAERRLVEASWNSDQDIAVGRVDFFGAGAAAALEVNATIPAMQAYSDIAAESWLRMQAGNRQQLAAALAANGSNAAALLQGLAEIYQRQRGDELASIALLCRRNDAQISELQYLRRRFREAGLVAEIVHPDSVTWRRGLLQQHNMPFQLVYRHLFLGRLDATPSAAVMAAMAPRERGTLVLNRPAAHLEMKSTLALLSLASTQPALAERIGLDADEVAALRASVPWTRTLSPSPESPESETRAILAAVIDDPDGHVLKRSWSYGGQAVFPGRARLSAAFAERARALFPGVNGWRELVLAAAADQRADGFVVQRAVAPNDAELIIATATGGRRQRMSIDYSAFASYGAAPAWGGVSRAAASDIVNIAAGGALLPVIRRSVADSLLASAADARETTGSGSCSSHTPGSVTTDAARHGSKPRR